VDTRKSPLLGILVPRLKLIILTNFSVPIRDADRADDGLFSPDTGLLSRSLCTNFYDTVRRVQYALG